MSARALFALALALTPAAAGQTPPEWSAVSMALMMRSCTAQACVHTYERDLRPSLLAFFPWRAVPFFVVLDHDDPENEAARLPERFSARAPFAQVRFSWTEAGTDAAVWGHRGHERQQYTQYFADYYTDAELVGFVDSDTLFITPVTRGDLFDERLRPRIIGQVGRPADDVYWDAVPAITQGMLKLESVCRGMAYFPVLLRTAHLAALRAHIARVHGRPFAEVFREHCAARRQCSCYDVMLTYVWTFHRNDYAWHFQQYDPFWLPSTVRGQVANFSFLTPANTQPTVRVAVHVGQLGNYFFGAAASRWQDARFPPVGAAEVTVCVQRQVLWGWCSVVSWLHLAAGGSGGGGEEDDGKAGAGGVHSSWIAACDVLFGGEDGERQRQAQSVHALARVEGGGRWCRGGIRATCPRSTRRSFASRAPIGVGIRAAWTRRRRTTDVSVRPLPRMAGRGVGGGGQTKLGMRMRMMRCSVSCLTGPSG